MMHAPALSHSMLVVRALSYPIVIVTFALVFPHPSGIFDVFSDQGAFAWLLIYFCWPWVAYVAGTYVFRHQAEGMRKNILFAIGVLSLYSSATILVSVYASQNVSSIWGNPLSSSMFWRALNFPLSLLFWFSH